MPTSQGSEDQTQSSQDYKLVVYRSEDLQEVRSMNLSVSSLYVMISSVILLLCFLIFTLLAFTPLKRLIPGYGQMEANPRFLELVDGVNELGDQIDAQVTYIGALRTLLGTGLADSERGSLPKRDNQITTSVNASSAAAINVSRTDHRSEVIESGVSTELYDALSAGGAIKPVTGIVSSSFDPRINHYGIDILSPAQTPIMATMDGIVFSSGWDLETGYSLAIQHENNILSFYKHNSQLLKEKGTFVRAGEAVAIIGNTGTLSSGPHLHFELWHNGKPINPEDVFKF